MKPLVITNLVDAIREQQKLGLVEFTVRESVGGFQAIAKYRKAATGPWGVGCDADMVTAIQKALVSGEYEITVAQSPEGVTTYRADIPLVESTDTDIEDLLS